MEKIHVQCSNGHPLKARSHLRGQVLPCPRCGTQVAIPVSKDPLSDTGVMRILGEVEAPPPPPSTPRQMVRIRRCQRCEKEVSALASVCSHCHCYLGSIPDYLQKRG